MNTSALSKDNRVQAIQRPSASVTEIGSARNDREIPAEDAFDLRRQDSLKFLFQILLTSAVLFLCASQLIAIKENSPDKALYWSGITTTLAWWMPSPGNSKGTKSGS